MRNPEIDGRGKHIKGISDLCDGYGSYGFNIDDSFGTGDDDNLS